MKNIFVKNCNLVCVGHISNVLFENTFHSNIAALQYKLLSSWKYNVQFSFMEVLTELYSHF